MKKIPIYRNKTKFFLMVDDDDFDLVSQFNWHSQKVGRNLYAVATVRKNNNVSCKVINNVRKIKHRLKNGKIKIYFVKQKTVFAHWLIMNHSGKKHIDHINRNGLDNRKENLRLVSHTENMQNRRKPIHNKTGYKNIHIDGNKYSVAIERNKKRFRKRGFKTINEAKKYLDLIKDKFCLV